jgi:hypothetical protein
MITKKSCIETTAIYSDDQKCRYVLRKVWDNALPMATFIGINPSDATELFIDKTVMNLMNHLVKIGGYGGVNIVNLFAFRAKKQKELSNRSDILEQCNIQYISEALKHSELAIIGWGRDAERKKQYREAINVTKRALSKYENIQCFKDGKGNVNCHLSIGYNNSWTLIDYKLNMGENNE